MTVLGYENEMVEQYLYLFWIFHISLQSLSLGKNGSCNSSGGCSYGLVCLNGECVGCGDGWYGVNCSLPCPDGYFGKRCTKKCECQICDAVLGCVGISTLGDANSQGGRIFNTKEVQTSSEGRTSTGTKSTNHPLGIYLLVIFGIVGLVLLCLAIIFGAVYVVLKKRENDISTVAIESIQNVQGLDMDLQNINESVSDHANQCAYELVYEEIHENDEDDVHMECARRGMMLPSPEPNVDENIPEHEYIEIIDVDSTYLEPCSFITA